MCLRQIQDHSPYLQNMFNLMYDYGYNAQQSQIAIGSGGLLGKGFVNGSQTQLGFLPEKRTDFAFAVLGEERGFLGSMVLVFLYTTLFAIKFSIAHRSKNYFSKLVSIGIFALFGVHFAINIGMTISLLPVIGDLLPFLSYGGSTTAASLICVGLLLSSITSTKVISVLHLGVYALSWY